MEGNAFDVASAFVAARRSGDTIAAYPGVRPANLAEAYEIQDRALSLWNRKIGGWKVGRIGAPADVELGANRLAGPIFSDTIVEANGRSIEMPIFEHGFAAAEAEFMLRLEPPQGAAVPETNADAMAWVNEVRIGIEIASSPYPGINLDGPCVTISDHGNNAGLILGPKVERALWDDLDGIEVEMLIDGKTVGKANTSTMLDGPFGAARFLLANLHDRAIEPQAGWWVSSGAVTGVHEIALGSSFEAVFEGVGTVRSSAGNWPD